MGSKIEHLYEYNCREDWVNYAMDNMKNVRAERHKEHGSEIWLSSERGVIGKWYDEIGCGYIEEYRDDKRIAKNREELESER